MGQTRVYLRSLYRLPVIYPAMYCVMSTVGEGTITNLSAVGCTIETDQPLQADQDVGLCLLLPDRHESLPIEFAHVRWAHAKRAGLEFVHVEPAANLRLYGFVLDQMVERTHKERDKVSGAIS
jgi:c-di-GMP-binding flagellar brake protein YcgR